MAFGTSRYGGAGYGQEAGGGVVLAGAVATATALALAGTITAPGAVVSGELATATATALAGTISGGALLSGVTATASATALAGTIRGGVGVVGATATATAIALPGTLVILTYLDTTASGQRTREAFATAELDIVPTVDLADPVIFQTNITMPTPVLNGHGRPDPAAFVPVTTTTAFGGFQVIVGGKDMTRVRGHRTVIESYSTGEPFGDATAVLRYPAVSPFEDIGELAAADIKALGGNPNVTIWRVRSDGTVDRTAQPYFQGFVVSEDDGISDTETDGLTQQCVGAIWQAQFGQHQPHFGLDARDIGEVIAAELNSLKGRRTATCEPPFINIPTRKRGSWGPKTDYMQELVAEAQNSLGDQWTVLLDRGRKPVIRLKDKTTAHWAITVGTPGLNISLSRDRTQAPNVIYGTGVTVAGQRWANTRYPNLRYDTVPEFPYALLSEVLANGTDDADTDSGTGVTDWQTQAEQLGYDTTPDGTYAGTDVMACQEIQRRAGLPVTGMVDADTWTFTFNIGADVGTLTGAYFAPLAAVSAREPFLYDAAGSVTGLNPDYDPRVIRVERWVDYGEGVSRAEAAASAREEIARGANVDFSGTLTLKVDPESGTRWAIRAGQNINLKHYRGRPTTLLHIARAEQNPQTGTVTLTVDTQARDALTLDAVRKRNRDATDPARALRGKRTSARTQLDTRPIWDAESGAGRIPSFPKSADSWSVVRVPAGQAGTVARIEMTTSGSACRFSTAVFGRPITAADMDRLVGRPLLTDGDGGSKYDSALTALEAEGFLEGFGGPGMAAGYHPGTDPDSDAPGSHVLTGKLVDSGGFEFNSLHPPWLWVAVWTDLACYVRGRMYLSVLDA